MLWFSLFEFGQNWMVWLLCCIGYLLLRAKGYRDTSCYGKMKNKSHRDTNSKHFQFYNYCFWLTHISSLSTPNSIFFRSCIGLNSVQWTPETKIFIYVFSLVTDNHVDRVIHELLIWRRILTTFTNKLFDYMHCSPLVDHKSRCCLFSRKSPCRSLSFQFRIWSN